MPTAKKSELPDWRTGTDRQRGKALWRYLRGRGEVDSLRRIENRRRPMVKLSKLMNAKSEKIYLYPINEERQRDLNATFVTAFNLVALGRFVAAGALYVLLMQRMEQDIAPELIKYRRQQGAKKSRERRSELAAAGEQRVLKVLASLKKPSSSKAIAGKAGVSVSKVVRARRKMKNT